MGLDFGRKANSKGLITFIMASCEENWRECCKWLTRVGLLSADHRANWPTATIKDLAYTLRDGVQLCRLLNLLQPGALDLKDISQRPQMAQVDLKRRWIYSMNECGRNLNRIMFDFICSFCVCGTYAHSFKFAKLFSSSKIRTCFNLPCFSTYLILAKFSLLYLSCPAVRKLQMQGLSKFTLLKLAD